MLAQHATGDARNTTAPPQPAAELAAHLQALAMIAYDHEPDWDAVYEGAGHDWCGDTANEAASHLAQRGIDAHVVTGGFRGCHHTWLELADGTIVDLTIDQYIDRTEDRCVTDHEVPWAPTDEGDRVAVIGPGHPLHASYHAPGR